MECLEVRVRMELCGSLFTELKGAASPHPPDAGIPMAGVGPVSPALALPALRPNVHSLSQDSTSSGRG